MFRAFKPVLQRLEQRQCLAGVSFVSHTIDETLDSPQTIETADIDGDGDLDLVLSAGTEGVLWYENAEGLLGERRRVSNGERPRTSVDIAIGDIDGDGDFDVVSLSSGGEDPFQTAWFENLDGQGSFGSEQIIEFFGPFAGGHSVDGGDMDGDGDFDFVTLNSYERGNYGSSHVSWFENTDGLGTYEQHTISVDVPGVLKAAVVDVDMDGDLDVATNVAWFRNEGFARDFAQLDSDIDRYVGSISVGDIDGDGDRDILSSGLSEIAWQENTDGLGEFNAGRFVDGDVMSTPSLALVDLDNDHDLDAVAASVDARKITWYENVLGPMDPFGEKMIVGPSKEYFWVHAADIDGDGDNDLVSVERFSISWHENLLILKPGDVNRDGIFNSADLVAIFQAGEYEDELADNSTYEEGDFDGDGDFTSSDLVFVFQADTFVSETRDKSLRHSIPANPLRRLDDDYAKGRVASSLADNRVAGKQNTSGKAMSKH